MCITLFKCSNLANTNKPCQTHVILLCLINYTRSPEFFRKFPWGLRRYMLRHINGPFRTAFRLQNRTERKFMFSVHLYFSLYKRAVHMLKECSTRQSKVITRSLLQDTLLDLRANMNEEITSRAIISVKLGRWRSWHGDDRWDGLVGSPRQIVLHQPVLYWCSRETPLGSHSRPNQFHLAAR